MPLSEVYINTLSREFDAWGPIAPVMLHDAFGIDPYLDPMKADIIFSQTIIDFHKSLPINGSARRVIIGQRAKEFADVLSANPKYAGHNHANLYKQMSKFLGGVARNDNMDKFEGIVESLHTSPDAIAIRERVAYIVSHLSKPTE